MRKRAPLVDLVVTRPIVPDWQCAGTGDCCRAVSGIRMSLQEAALIQERALGKALVWKPAQPFGFVELQAHPCPLLEGNRCTVYDIRPFKCRQFLCFRAPGEPFESGGPLGCLNLSDRVEQDRETRRAYELNQRKAGRWAIKHGWTGQET